MTCCTLRLSTDIIDHPGKYLHYLEDFLRLACPNDENGMWPYEFQVPSLACGVVVRNASE